MLLDDSNFGATLCGSGAFAADGSSFTHAGHTLEPAMQLPIGSRRRFYRGFVSISIEAQQLLQSVGLHLSTPPFHHTPWGLLSWQLDCTAITASSLGLALRPFGQGDWKKVCACVRACM